MTAYFTYTKALISVVQETPMYEPVFVLPESVWVEKSPQAGRAGQLCTQVVLAHMGADGHIGGGRSFVATLNLAMVNPLVGCHINMKGCHCSRDSDLKGLRNGQRGSLQCLHAPSATDTGGSGLTFSDSWGVVWIWSKWQPFNISWQGAEPLAGIKGQGSLKEAIQAFSIGPNHHQFHLLEACNLQAIGFLGVKVACCNKCNL